jgi:hypothetical protein
MLRAAIPAEMSCIALAALQRGPCAGFSESMARRLQHAVHGESRIGLSSSLCLLPRSELRGTPVTIAHGASGTVTIPVDFDNGPTRSRAARSVHLEPRGGAIVVAGLGRRT